ncbi:DUF305 domain-containing protein [Streptomyces sp. WAC05374]|uniref:DUF305 domain-containing protein n=1 Tax=Streptomyces sp. WAC05374 TaxID=2487420 RepID=UPI000F88AB1A|nr:DUF305 domain-containing protein [Streptomyces sp. WAC05374]TDF50910.1 DUF305 domain-containing protein [Streptomyces sp. WAC05374]TDF57131.1 DUF305 domain-containing protein [Streptomyces sp. WAC05374]TDF61161.1 DUF305 domain-containing protein [Streptomyces sp. WAC05374]
MKRTTSVAAAAALTAALALAACESAPPDKGDEPQARAGGGSGAPAVVAPGKPGEPARTLSPEEARRAVPPDTPNSADFTYAQMMIVHHGQALEMSALAAKHAVSPQVKQVAARIAAAQGPEIGAMRGWLKNNGNPPSHGGHDHGAMPGMATEAQLDRLRAARGRGFDELFLKLMITHHQGAVTMAGEVLAEGNNIQVEEMATDVIAQQTAEINRMRSM